MKLRLVVLAFAAAAVAAVVAQRPSGAQQPAPAPANAHAAQLSLADLMSATQLRHLKLAYSGNVSNWPLANYELGRIQQSFSAAAQLYPVFKTIPLAELIKQESEPPLADLGKAIDGKSRSDFMQAFAKLTDACNRCHQAAGVGFIVIRIPTSSPFSNQLFPPAEK